MSKRLIVFSDVHGHMKRLEMVKTYLLDHTENLEKEIGDAYNTLNLQLVELFKRRAI